MSAPILHNFDLDEACYAIRLVASVCKFELSLRNVDVFPGAEHLSPRYMALNPLGRIPILEDGALILREPEAILRTIAGRAGRLMPSDATVRARMDDWLAFAGRELPVCAEARAVALLDAPGDLDALTAQARLLLRVMDDHMAEQEILGHGFFAGGEMTLADLALFPGFALSRDYGVDHDEYAALRLWARRVRASEGFITMPGIPDYH